MTEQEAIQIIKHKVGRFQNDVINDALDVAIKALEEVQQYRAIGNVEECRATVEKMKAKKTKTKVNEEDVRIGCVVFAKGTKVHYCPECNRPVTGADVYCRNCGQALIW